MASAKSKLLNLLTVKSILTFALTGAFVYLTVIGKVDEEIFMTIYTMVISFYFGTQAAKEKSTT